MNVADKAMEVIGGVIDTKKLGRVEDAAADALTLVMAAVQAWREHKAGFVTPEVAMRQLEKLEHALGLNDAKADAALAAKFKKEEDDR